MYKVRSSTVDTKTKTKTKYLCIIICPKKFKFAHNVFEVTELCRTRADISELKIRRRRDSTTADVVEGAWVRSPSQ